MVLLGAASSTRADGEGLAGSGSSGHTNDGFQEEHIRHRAGDLVDGLHQRDSGVAADRLGRHGLGPNADTTAVASITQLVGRGAGQASAADRELQQVGRDGSDRGGLGTAGVTADHGGGFGADNAAQFVRHEALMQGGVVDLQRSGVQAQSQLRLLIQVERCEEAEVGGSAGNQGVGHACAACAPLSFLTHMILVDTSKGLIGGVSQQRAAHDGVQRRAFLHINQRAGHDAFDQRDVQLFVHLDGQGSGEDRLNAIGRSAALDELLLGAVAQGEVVDDLVEFTLELVLVDLDDRLGVGAEEAQTQGSFPTGLEEAVRQLGVGVDGVVGIAGAQQVVLLRNFLQGTRNDLLIPVFFEDAVTGAGFVQCTKYFLMFFHCAYSLRIKSR